MKRSAPDTALARARHLLVEAFLLPLRFYMRFISPGLPRRCKYEPTCSAYALEAVRELGIVRGSILAGWRLLRCNPWSHGGWDPVSNRRLFRAHDHAEHHHNGAPA